LIQVLWNDFVVDETRVSFFKTLKIRTKRGPDIYNSDSSALLFLGTIALPFKLVFDRTKDSIEPSLITNTSRSHHDGIPTKLKLQRR